MRTATDRPKKQKARQLSRVQGRGRDAVVLILGMTMEVFFFLFFFRSFQNGEMERTRLVAIDVFIRRQKKS